ncbi:MAG TPA: M3 family metallopeptidase, partial [Vicinamibacterales bacterium]|nr:M3 family metallopeptidase [Vicinamibacterales bacterium]
ELEAAAIAAKSRGLDGKWVLPLRNTTQQGPLASLTNRATREKLFRASWTRAERGDANDTRQTIATLASLRARKAALLGYPDFAAWVLETRWRRRPGR